MMLHKTFAFETKEVDDADGTFTGYAAVFGNKDLGGDVVEPGAFTRTLKENGGKFILAGDHDWRLAARLGFVEASEDDTGLKVVGHFNLEKQYAKDVYSDVRHALANSLPMGMSFGYDIVKSTFDKKEGTMHLLDLTVYEASITQFPMNHAAGVTSVKAQLEQIERMSMEERRELIKALSEGPFTTSGVLYDPLHWDAGTSGTITATGGEGYYKFDLGAQDSEAIALLETLTERVRASA